MQRYKDLGAEEVEAAEVLPATVNEIAVWCKGVEVVEIDPFNPALRYVGVNVPTAEGNKRASQYTFVVKDYAGDFFVLEDWKFHARYQRL